MTMNLTLDHLQRLNLHALMGAQRGSVSDVRLFWRLQDKIDLNDEEKRRINYRVQEINGMLQPAWDPGKALEPVTYSFTEEEYKRLEKMVEEWQPGFLAAMDRLWLEPLLAQFEALKNGQPK